MTTNKRAVIKKKKEKKQYISKGSWVQVDSGKPKM